MSDIKQFLGMGLNAPPKSIVNWFSAGGASPINLGGGGNAKKTLSGALTANTYKEILAVSGPGCIGTALVYCVDATSRTMGIKVVIDGVTVFDASCSANTNASYGMYAIGNSAAAGSVSSATPKVFNSSLSISIKSSISETDKIGLGYEYDTI